MTYLSRLFTAGLLASAAVMASPTRTQLLSGLPLRFEEDRSRPSGAEYSARGTNYRLSLTAKESWLDWTDPAGGGTSRLRTRLLNARKVARLEPSDPLPGSVNYLLGGSEKWRTGVAGYGSIRYRQVYPGIDLVFHGEQGRLEYDFILQPHADPAAIRLDLSGQQDAYVDADGDLVVVTSAGQIRWKRPEVYQDYSGERKSIAAHFALTGKGIVGFAVGDYDRSRPLIIDPTLSYLSYLGGTVNDVARGIAVDNNGNAYVVGISNSLDLPVVSAYQPTMHGGTANFASGDAFIAKFSPSGTLVYLTYLGGSADDGASAIAVDTSGNAYVTGFTSSTDFPTVNPYQKSLAGANGTGFARFGDVFIAKLNPTGNGLIYSTYLGGSQDDLAMAIAIDSAGDAYIAGSTQSANFPTTPGVVQTTSHGGGGEPPVDCCDAPIIDPGDAFVVKLAPSGSSLIFSTLLGGSQDDFATTLAVDASANVYIAGFTLSTNFPTTSGAFQTTFGGEEAQNYFFHTGDGFISKLNSTATQLVYSTYLGGVGDDWVSAIAVDQAGDVYFTGSSTSGAGGGADLPTTPGVFQPAYAGYDVLPYTGVELLGDAIVGELNPAGSALIYLTYLGGAENDAGQAIAIDSQGNAYVAGFTDSTNFPTANGPFQPAYGGGGGNYVYLMFGDAFLAEVSPGGTKLLYSTYLGGSLDDLALGLALDGKGNVYLAGSTESRNLATTSNAVQRTFQGMQYSRPSFLMGDAFYAVVSGFPSPPLTASVLNGASFANQPVAPGSLITIFGTFPGTTTASASGIPLPDSLGGASVTINGNPVPLNFVNATQINTQVPWDTAPGPATAVVTSGGFAASPFQFNVAATNPGIFTYGTNLAVAQNDNYSVNGPSSPAKVGGFVIVYMTGGGAVKPPIQTGDGTPAAPVSYVTADASATIGGKAADILFLGMAPGFVGVGQADVKIPDLTAGAYPIVITVGGVQSNGPMVSVSEK
jgi:uncharacterized protein (TIGR03437 family)